MRTRSLSLLVSSLLFFVGSAALAQSKRQMKDFTPTEMTEEERKAKKLSGPKYNINEYGSDIKIKEEPFPWMAVGLGVIVLAAATPFALRAYRDTSKEIADANTFGTASTRVKDEE